MLDWGSDTDTGLWVKVQFIGSATPILFASCYVPPSGSRQLQALDITSRFTSLSAQITAACNEGHVLVGGDFNARVGTLPDSIDLMVPVRGCTDAVVAGHGLRLLELCKGTGMLLCMGRVEGDRESVPTFRARSHTQATRPDHVLASSDTLALVSDMMVNTTRRDSDHHPIELTMSVYIAAIAPVAACAGTPLSRVRWQRASHTYAAALGTAGAPASIAAASACALAGDSAAAFQALDAGMRAAAAASGMPVKTPRTAGAAQPRVHAPFFDAECRQLKRQLNATMRNGASPLELRALERLYHHTVRAKRRTYRLAQLRSLIAKLQSDPRALWQRLKSQQSDLPEQLKPVQAWDAYLKRVACLELLSVAVSPLASFPVHAPAAGACEPLHASITLGEVLAGLKRLRNGRASGVDGLPAELLRYAKAEAGPVHVLAPVLVDVLNAAFTCGALPAAVNSSLVTPVHKKGSKVDPLNYRPIAVTQSVMRLYASILNARLMTFAEDTGLRADTQAGFRPGRSTVHQIFTLQHLIDKHR